MKFYKAITVLLLVTRIGFAQSPPLKRSAQRAGSLYFYWGWNRDNFSKSDIHFQGNTYDFTLDDVIADDRQSDFEADLYLNPGTMTIPQYNFRIGYFINDHYSISIGTDHMKYVMRTDQSVKISGTISETETTYNGTYDNEDINLTQDFLIFEHTDGLNYVNAEFRRMDELFATKWLSINILEGFGIGGLYPRTNCTILGNERNDEFHLSGYGLDALVGVNFEFFRVFFIQSEIKGGFINMPDIRITSSSSDKASQHFFFSQANIVFGAIFNLRKKTAKVVE